MCYFKSKPLCWNQYIDFVKKKKNPKQTCAVGKTCQSKEKGHFQLLGTSLLVAYTLHPLMLNFRHTSQTELGKQVFRKSGKRSWCEDKGGSRVDFSIIGNRKVIQASMFNKIKVHLPSFLQIVQKYSSVKGSWIKSFFRSVLLITLRAKTVFSQSRNIFSFHTELWFIHRNQDITIKYSWMLVSPWCGPVSKCLSCLLVACPSFSDTMLKPMFLNENIQLSSGWVAQITFIL